LVAMLWTLMPGPGDHFDFVLMHANSEVPANDLLTTQSEADPFFVRAISRYSPKSGLSPTRKRPERYSFTQAPLRQFTLRLLLEFGARRELNRAGFAGGSNF